MEHQKYDYLASNNYLSNLSKDGTPFRGRVALLSYQNEVSAKLLDQLILFIEYGQMMILLLILNQRFYKEHESNSIELFNLLSVFKALGPGNLLPIKKMDRHDVILVLEICFAFYMLRILLFLYIIMLALKRKKGFKFLVRLWRWIFRLQAKTFQYGLASVYATTFDSAMNKTVKFESNEGYSIMVVSILMVCLELLLSLTLSTQFTNVLPFKRYTAAKDNYIQISLVIQKFTNNILRRLFGFGLVAGMWIYAFLNLGFSAFRIYHFFNRLPVYNPQSLKFQMYLLILLAALGVSNLAQVIRDQQKINMNTLIITWIILSILCIKLANAFLNKIVMTLAFEKGINMKRTPEMLVHKITIIKQLLKQNQAPGEISKKCHLAHLLFSTLQTTRISTLDLKSLDLNCKETRNKIFISYLEDLMAHFPKNNFIKLYTAYYYTRKSRLYGLSIKTLTEIQNSNYPTVVATKSILKHLIQTRIRADYRNGTYILNLYDYCQSVSHFSQIKLCMIQHLKFQHKLCNQITNINPNLAQILNLGNKAFELKHKIQIGFKRLSEQIPDQYAKPSLIYSYYTLFLNYSSEEYEKYQATYSMKFLKYNKWFENDKLFKENIFQDNKTFIIAVSGERETSGIIKYSSPELVEILGRNMTGSQANVATPPFIRANTASLIKHLTGHDALSFSNTERFQFFYHSKGYMIPFNYYLNNNPSIYGGLSFIFMCRVANLSQEFILLNDDGEIESFTKDIGDILSLCNKSKDECYSLENKVQIKEICPELLEVNEAINLITTLEKDQNLLKTEDPQNYIEEAKKLYSNYSKDEGKNILLASLDKTNNSLLEYRCIVKPLMVGTRVGKIISLEKIHHSNTIINLQENTDEHDQKENTTTQLVTTRNEELLSPNTLSSARKLFTPRSTSKTDLHHNKSEEFLDEQGKENNHPNQIAIQNFNNAKPHWLAHNKPKTIKLYQQALQKSYFPFFYRVLLAILYLIFALVFGLYLSMSLKMHQGISDLKVSKQILRMTEARTNYLGTLDGAARYLWIYATQDSNVTDLLVGSILSKESLLLITHSTLVNLDQTSNSLFHLTSSLVQKDRDKLFDKDVRLFDSTLDSYINLTNFQATDRIIETGFQVINTAQIDLDQAVPYLSFILRNAMNDLLMKNYRISEFFKVSLEDKKTHFATLLTNYFAVALSLVVIVVLIFIYVLYLQARNESKNLLALTKLRPESIQSLQQDFLAFRRILFENHLDPSQQHNSESFTKQNNLSRKGKTKSQTQYPVYKGLWISYYFGFFKIAILILFLIIFFLANFIVFKNYLNQLSIKAYQIYFIEQLNSRLGILSGSFLETISENDSTVIANMKASDSLKYQMQQIGKMIKSISNTIGIESSEVDALIQNILYKDSCHYLQEIGDNFNLCKSLANYQENTGLINLLNNLEALMNSLYLKFINSDHTSDTLLTLQAEAFNKISTYIFLVLQPVNVIIVDMLNDDFGDTVDSCQLLNMILNTVILVLIVFECFAIHFLIINRFKQKETQFRRILAMFPPSIVLPNFILKSYIIKTSNQTFSSFGDFA